MGNRSGHPIGDAHGDTYAIADAAWHAGATLVRDGYPNDALKHFQLGGFWAGKATSGADNPRMPTLVAWLTLNHDGWEPRDAFERAGRDRATAAIHVDLGQLDTAEQLAASALRTCGEGHRRGRIMAELLLAEVQVRAGDPQGLILARHAIAGVSTSQSLDVRRQRLIPLAVVLEARPSTDTRELARAVRHVATTRL
jgi:hypothetical protein